MDAEKIFSIIIGIALCALLIGNFRRKTSPMENPVEQSVGDTPRETLSGPAYLIANAPVWAFSPPVNNFIPSAVIGGGQAVMVNPGVAVRDFTCYGNC